VLSSFEALGQFLGTAAILLQKVTFIDAEPAVGAVFQYFVKFTHNLSIEPEWLSLMRQNVSISQIPLIKVSRECGDIYGNRNPQILPEYTQH